MLVDDCGFWVFVGVVGFSWDVGGGLLLISNFENVEFFTFYKENYFYYSILP